MKTAKSAVRAVMGLPPWTATTPLLRQLNLMPISDRFEFRLLCLLYRCQNNLASPLLSSLFIRTSATSSYSTRGAVSGSLVLPEVRLNVRILAFHGAVKWNSLPSLARSASSFALFKQHCLSFLGYPVSRLQQSVGKP